MHLRKYRKLYSSLISLITIGLSLWSITKLDYCDPYKFVLGSYAIIAADAACNLLVLSEFLYLFFT